MRNTYSESSTAQTTLLNSTKWQVVSRCVNRVINHTLGVSRTPVKGQSQRRSQQFQSGVWVCWL